MEITLEKIELVKDRTGVSYKEAKEALENGNGSVVDAIIAIEETIDIETKSDIGSHGEAIIESIKDIVKKGNVSRIQIKNTQGEKIVNIPVNVGIVGAVIAPIPMLIASISALGFKYTIEVIKDDGTIIDISNKTSDAMERVSEKGSEIYESVKNNKTYEKVKEKTEEAVKKTSEVIKNKFNKTESNLEDLEDELSFDGLEEEL